MLSHLTVSPSPCLASAPLQAGVKVVYTGLGPVTGSDANLAAATGAALLCFNLAPPEPAVASVLSAAGVALLQHNVIYRLLDEMQARLAGLAPEEEVEVVVGRAEVRPRTWLPLLLHAMQCRSCRVILSCAAHKCCAASAGLQASVQPSSGHT